MVLRRFGVALAGAVALMSLNGCGGAVGSTQIAGSVTGLIAGTSVELTNNNQQTVTVSSNGTFLFNGLVTPGTNYAVTVKRNPVGELCTVTNGTGTVGQYSADVNNILVTCSQVNGDVYGLVSGLTDGASLQLTDTIASFYASQTDTLTVTANGAFVFGKTVTYGDTYAVSIAVQPTGQTCTISDGSGTIPKAGGSNAVLISCQ